MNAELEKPLLLRPENEEACIMADKVSQIYAGTNNAIIATIINSSILAKIMWPVIGHQTLLIWLSYAFGISLLRGITAFRYQKKPPLPEHAYRWMWLYILGSSLAALSWSAATIWLFPADDVARQVFLAFVIGGMAAGAVTNMSHLKLAIYPYLCFTLTPLIGRFFYDHSELGGDMGIMTSLYLLMLLFAVRRAHSNIDQNIQLRIEAAARESALAKSQQRYKTLLEKTTDAFILHDLNGKFLEVNQQACRSLGYSRDELLGMSVKDIEVKRGEDELRCLWDKLSENKTIMLEGMHRRKDGEKFPVEISVGPPYYT